MQNLLLSLRQRYGHPPLIGAAFAALIVLCPIIMGGHAFLIFFSLGGLVIVVGGVITVAFMSFEAEEVRKALDVVMQMFRERQTPPKNLHNDVTAIIYCARLLRNRKGLRNLETVIGKSGIRDPFLRYGLNMVLSDYSPEEVRAMLEIAADASYERDSVPVEILQTMASHGPAFGMIGTLVGMVAMLCNLGDTISGIGPSLAVAFLSTLYGVLSARMFYMPAESKLRQEVEHRRLRNHLIIEGMVMLVAQRTPMYVQDRLNGFLRPESHDYLDVTRPELPKAATPRIAVAA
ncbi:MAG: MotA/TolQ/ExbB proton channel family protein [Alphaproteobacteria bacterium]|nr:MotA/TolQ/ExbB proton channel family protein [Alphaproteobacteria bacterium]